MARREHGRRRRRPGTWLTLTGAVLLLAGLALHWAFPPARILAPTGPYAVGTTVVEWVDPARPEPATRDPDDSRFVVAQLWYPAEATPASARAWYLGRDAHEAQVVAHGAARSYGLPPVVLDRAAAAREPAGWAAPVASGAQRFPLVLFSPGLQGIRQQNTAWAIELASHGYVVAALDHPYDSAVVVRADGSVVTSTVRSTGNDVEDQRRADGWTAIRAADLSFVLTRLAAGDPGSGGSAAVPLAGRLDLDHVAVTGHSLGGAAALQAATLDRRIRAAIDLDGLPRTVRPGDHHPPVLVLVAGRESGHADNDRRYADAVAATLADSAPPSFRLTVAGAGHLSLTDAALYLPPLPSLFGTAGRTTPIRVTEQASLAFLDTTLRGADPAELPGRLADLGALTASGR